MIDCLVATDIVTNRATVDPRRIKPVVDTRLPTVMLALLDRRKRPSATANIVAAVGTGTGTGMISRRLAVPSAGGTRARPNTQNFGRALANATAAAANGGSGSNSAIGSRASSAAAVRPTNPSSRLDIQPLRIGGSSDDNSLSPLASTSAGPSTGGSGSGSSGSSGSSFLSPPSSTASMAYDDRHAPSSKSTTNVPSAPVRAVRQASAGATRTQSNFASTTPMPLPNNPATSSTLHAPHRPQQAVTNINNGGRARVASGSNKGRSGSVGITKPTPSSTLSVPVRRNITSNVTSSNTTTSGASRLANTKQQSSNDSIGDAGEAMISELLETIRQLRLDNESLRNRLSRCHCQGGHMDDNDQRNDQLGSSDMGMPAFQSPPPPFPTLSASFNMSPEQASRSSMSLAESTAFTPSIDDDDLVGDSIALSPPRGRPAGVPPIQFPSDLFSETPRVVTNVPQQQPSQHIVITAVPMNLHSSSHPSSTLPSSAPAPQQTLSSASTTTSSRVSGGLTAAMSPRREQRCAVSGCGQLRVSSRGYCADHQNSNVGATDGSHPSTPKKGTRGTTPRAAGTPSSSTAKRAFDASPELPVSRISARASLHDSVDFPVQRPQQSSTPRTARPSARGTATTGTPRRSVTSSFTKSRNGSDDDDDDADESYPQDSFDALETEQQAHQNAAKLAAVVANNNNINRTVPSIGNGGNGPVFAFALPLRQTSAVRDTSPAGQAEARQSARDINNTSGPLLAAIASVSANSSINGTRTVGTPTASVRLRSSGPSNGAGPTPTTTAAVIGTPKSRNQAASLPPQSLSRNNSGIMDGNGSASSWRAPRGTASPMLLDLAKMNLDGGGRDRWNYDLSDRTDNVAASFEV
jgi:hypothetical protein